MPDDAEIKACGKGGECDLISQDENSDDDMSNLYIDKMVLHIH